MAFFLSTSGHLHPYAFKYLEGQFEKARLEKTEIHSAIKSEHPKKLLEKETEFFAIDVMNHPVVSVNAATTLEKIREEMKKFTIRHVPIVKDHKLVGMISDRDMLKVDMAGTFLFLKAEDIMTSVLIVAEEETPLAHIARVLMEEKISALPIIDKNHKLTGMISRTDILRAVVYNRLILK